MYMPKGEHLALAEAIILQAVEDYRHATNRLKKTPDDVRLQNRKTEIEAFFLSGWFRVLTQLNGKKLLNRLQAESTGAEEAK